MVNEVCGGRESGRREGGSGKGRRWRREGGVERRRNGESEGKRKKEKMVKGIAGGVERKGHHKGMHETGGN